MAALLHQHLLDQDIGLSAKDPLNMAGFVAANILKGDVEVAHWQDLDSLDRNENVLLDVGTWEEVKQTGTIMDAVHIHVDQLRDRVKELDKDKTYIAYRILVQRGFKAKILGGGWDTWSPIQEDRLERAS
jgi:rhodanese-related sulfurtransferase